MKIEDFKPRTYWIMTNDPLKMKVVGSDGWGGEPKNNAPMVS